MVTKKKTASSTTPRRKARPAAAADKVPTDSLSAAVVSPPEALPGRSLPDEVAAHPLLSEAAWVALRDSGIEPLDRSEYVTTYESRAAFLVGAWLLDRSVKGGLLNNLKFQMLQVADVLAAGRFKNAIIEPRRSSKTTALWCVLLGRCWMQELHMAGYTMLTTQKKTAERYRIDVYGPITRKWPDPDTRPVKVYKGNGTERVEFPATSSVLAILSPDGEAFRSGAYDTLLADEGGEATPEMGDDITAAVLPAFDTRPDGQFITAGTAARYRDGNILHDTLADPKAGRLRYTVRDDVTAEMLEAWEPDDEHPEACVRELVESMHPGVASGLTTIEKIEANYDGLKLEQFSLEYLGLFGTVGGSTGIFDLEQWTAAGSGAEPPALPERFSLAFAIHPDASRASVLATWRGDDGRAVPLLLENRAGVEWLPKVLHDIARKYKTAVVYDAGSQQARLVVDRLNREPTRPRLEAQVWSDVKKAAALVVQEVARGNVAHFRQDDLDAAIRLAVKRAAGAGDGWALGRPKTDLAADITAAEAWALALLHYDSAKPRRRTRAVVVT